MMIQNRAFADRPRMLESPHGAPSDPRTDVEATSLLARVPPVEWRSGLLPLLSADGGVPDRFGEDQDGEDECGQWGRPTAAGVAARSTSGGQPGRRLAAVARAMRSS